MLQLMLYESAGVADTLCHNNQWQRCTVPLHALEAGLQHRQLDTVAFFLKSRENSMYQMLNRHVGPICDKIF